jgi:AbiV family abortive infection protein
MDINKMVKILKRGIRLAIENGCNHFKSADILMKNKNYASAIYLPETGFEEFAKAVCYSKVLTTRDKEKKEDYWHIGTGKKLKNWKKKNIDPDPHKQKIKILGDL